MILPFAQCLESIKDYIAAQGGSGVSYVRVTKAFQLNLQVAFHVAKHCLDGKGFNFRISGIDVCLLQYSLQQFDAAFQELECCPGSLAVDRICGAIDPGVILEEEIHLKRILEKISASGTRGCLVSELSDTVGAVHIHTHVDKLVGLGYIVKRSINPTTKSKKTRVDSKAVVIHNRKNASHYDEEIDGVKVITGNAYLDCVHQLILDILDKSGVDSMPTNEMFQHLGISRWDMQALRNATLSQNKKDWPSRVRFYRDMRMRRYDNGIIGPEVEMWCVGRLYLYDVSGGLEKRKVNESEPAGSMLLQCSRNMSTFETISAELQLYGRQASGVTAFEVRQLTGATYKRAARVFSDFHKSLNFPLEKFQDGKQLKYRILPKPSEGLASELTDQASLFSDQQRLNCHIIICYLEQNEGIASLAEIINIVRKESRARQNEITGTVTGSHTVDRRTIERTLTILESSLMRVVVRTVSDCDPLLPERAVCERIGPSITLYLLTEVVPREEEVIARYFNKICDPKDGRESSKRAHKSTRQGISKEDGESEDSKSHLSDDATAWGESDAGSVDEVMLPSRKRRKKEATASTPSLLNPNIHPVVKTRNQARKRALKQKRRYDDPEIFDWRVSLRPSGDEGIENVVSWTCCLAHTCGTLISVVSLHFQLLHALLGDRNDVSIAALSTVNFCVDSSTIRKLPFEFFYKTSDVFQDSLRATMSHLSFDAKDRLQNEIYSALTSFASISNVERTFADGTLPQKELTSICQYFLESVKCQREIVSLLCLLGSTGVLLLHNQNDKIALMKLMTDLSISLESIDDVLDSRDDRYDHRGVDSPREGSDALHGGVMNAFAQLFHRVKKSEHEQCEDIAKFFWGRTFRLNIIPPGAWQQVVSDLDVYHQWRTVILPSLPVDWLGLHLDHNMSNLGLHLIKYWGMHRPSELPAGLFSSINKSTYSHWKDRMDHWGNSVISAAWRETAPLHWTDLLMPSYFSSVPDANLNEEPPPVTDRIAFSLDMPRNSGTKRHGKRAITSMCMGADCESGLSGSLAAKRMGVTEREETLDDTLDLSNAPFLHEVCCSSAMRPNRDNQLLEELARLQGGPDAIELTTTQVALLMEIVLINFFTKERKVSLMPGALRPACPTDSLDNYCVLTPATSLLDLYWQDTYFGMVSESVLNSAILSSSLPDHKQKHVKHRIMQCIEHCPTAREAISWVLCNRGARVSQSFTRIMNQVLKSKPGSTATDPLNPILHSVASVILQNYCDVAGGASMSKNELAELRQFPLECVMTVTREFYMRGILQQSVRCSREQCRALEQSCPHNKRAFELTDGFADHFVGVPFAAFFKTLLISSTAAPADPVVVSIEFRNLLRRPQFIPMGTDDEARQAIMYISHSLCWRPRCANTSFNVLYNDFSHADLQLGVLASSNPSAELLLRPELCQRHTGFCEGPLNGIAIEMTSVPILAASMTTSLHFSFRMAFSEATIPWKNTRGDINFDLLRLLSSKVLALLSDRPGANIVQVHTTLMLLSEIQVSLLMEELVSRGWVRIRRSTITATLANPFSSGSIQMLRRQQPSKVSKAENAYFTGMLMCG